MNQRAEALQASTTCRSDVQRCGNYRRNAAMSDCLIHASRDIAEDAQRTTSNHNGDTTRHAVLLSSSHRVLKLIYHL